MQARMNLQAKRHAGVFLCISFVVLAFCLGFITMPRSMKEYLIHSPRLVPVHMLFPKHNALRSTMDDALLTLIDDITLSDTDTEDIQRPNRLNNYSCNGVDTFHGVEDLLCQQPPKVLKKYKNPCWHRNGSFVCMPYFQLIGMGKSGTTDLFTRILLHPSILHNDGYLEKETFWWSCRRYGHMIDRSYKIENFNRYLQYFSSASKRIQKMPSEDFITGDGNPRDLFCMGGWVHIPQNQGLREPKFITPHLMKHVNPNVKLLVLLRDPVERLYSDFFHRRRGNLTASGFDKAVRHSIAILHKCTRHSSLRGCLYNRSLQLNVTSRLHMGFYYIFMKDWLDVFPRKQILIFRTEDYHKDITTYMQNVFQFLNVRNLTKAEIDKLATTPITRITKGKSEAGPMQDNTRDILRRLYRPFNEKLADLLDDRRYLWNY